MAAPPPPSGEDVVRLAARAYEPDRYLSALLAPKAAQADLLALAAFAGEVARIPGYVDEPMVGEIRLQWWRDAIDGFASPYIRSGNPIADALGGAVRRHGLPVAMLHGIVDAHVARLDDTPFTDMEALSANISRIDGAQFDLACRALAPGPTALEPALIADAGQAYGLARLLLELPVTLSQGKVLLPRERLTAHGCDPAQLSKADGSSLAPVIAELVARIETHAARIRAGWRQLSPDVHAALRPLALVRPYLHASESIADDPLAARDVLPLKRIWRLWRTGRTIAI